MSLPPGQHDFGTFPRFGIPFWEPHPPTAQPALLRVAGAVARLGGSQLVIHLPCRCRYSVCLTRIRLTVNPAGNRWTACQITSRMVSTLQPP